MATLTQGPTSRGRARGLLLVWRMELEWKLQINNYLPGHGRGDTLGILVEKQPERRPGDKQWTSDKEEVEPCHMESIRTQWQQTGTHLEGHPLRQPGTWPKCLGGGIHITLSSSPRSVDNSPSPIPSSSSSDFSGPPSLESIMEPESGYEVSMSSSSDTE